MEHEIWLDDDDEGFVLKGADLVAQCESGYVRTSIGIDALLSWLAEHDDKLAEAGSQYRVVRRG